MKNYEVIHPVRFDGRLYDRGTLIDLGEKDALRLLDHRVIRSLDVLIRTEPAARPHSAGSEGSEPTDAELHKIASLVLAQAMMGAESISNDNHGTISVQPVVVQSVVLGASTLAKFSKLELIDYAAKAHGITLTEEASKDDILAAIAARADAAVADAIA